MSQVLDRIVWTVILAYPLSISAVFLYLLYRNVSARGPVPIALYILDAAALLMSVGIMRSVWKE